MKDNAKEYFPSTEKRNGRIPIDDLPSDPEAERSLVWLLLEGKVNWETVSGIPSDAFYTFPLRWIYLAAASVAESGQSPNWEAVQKRLLEQDGFNSCQEEIANLQEHYAGYEPEHYYRRILEAYRNRLIFQQTEELRLGRQTPEEFLQAVNAIPSAEKPKSVGNAIVGGAELASMTIKEREPLLGTWWREGDLGFLFGKRGLGKTWLSMEMARALAEGRNCGPWGCHKQRRVLYVDGEMPLDSTRQRNEALTRGEGDVRFLHHDRLFEVTGRILNLSDADTQRELLQQCRKNEIDVVFIDNLSSLVSGIRENDADDWERMLKWLLEFRRYRIAVCIVHHSGRSGDNMRGTSRREDAAFWVMRLDEPVNAVLKEGEGAEFISRFTKDRNGGAPGPISWRFEPNGDKCLSTYQSLSNLDLLRIHIQAGVTNCTDIAELMGTPKGTVSKLAAKAERQGWLKRKGQGKEYELIG